MRPALVFALLILGLLPELFDASAASGGTVRVRGYTRRDGTYVQPHYRSAPNSTKADNWSTRGNVNPYTGQAGTRSLYQGGGGGGITSGTPFIEPHLVPSEQPPAAYRAPAPFIPQRSVAAPSSAAPTTAPRGALGIQVIEGGGVYDERKADLDYQRFHAAKGNPESQYAMAMRHLKGIGVPQDEAAALEYLKAADRNGHLKARAKLSEMNAAKRKAQEEAAAHPTLVRYGAPANLSTAEGKDSGFRKEVARGP